MTWVTDQVRLLYIRCMGISSLTKCEFLKCFRIQLMWLSRTALCLRHNLWATQPSSALFSFRLKWFLEEIWEMVGSGFLSAGIMTESVLAENWIGIFLKLGEIYPSRSHDGERQRPRGPWTKLMFLGEMLRWPNIELHYQKEFCPVPGPRLLKNNKFL